MKTKTIVLENDQLIRSLEKIQYETEAHKDLLGWMLNNHYDITAPTYQKYHNEYIELFKQYQKLKYQFEREYVRKNMSEDSQIHSWHLDYNTNTVTIEYD